MKLQDILNNPSLLDTVGETDEVSRDVMAIERPNDEVSLLAIDDRPKVIIKSQKDPTDDLVLLKRGEEAVLPEHCDGGYVVWCADTEETWYAPDKQCLDANFIYRDDLEIVPVEDEIQAQEFVMSKNKDLLPGVITRKTCYVLDNPGTESYEVYYDPSYPAQRYGKSTPQGTFVHQYKNRFYRDMAILALDESYTKSSVKAAKEFIKKQLKDNEAIIVSDGAAIENTIGHAFFYIDSSCLTKVSEATFPSDENQKVLISEVNGAYRALSMCAERKKKYITYYYDNTSILNVFKNRKTEYIEEIKRYKDLCATMTDKGYVINFVEIHPKTGENRAAENAALMYFHNTCDGMCREIIDVFSRDFTQRAMLGNRNGQSIKDIRPQQKKNYNNGGYRRY